LRLQGIVVLETRKLMMLENSILSGGEGVDPVVELRDPDRELLLGLARKSVAAAVTGDPAPGLRAIVAGPGLMEARACFVTLRLGAELRGCIGQVTAREPLWLAVVQNAGRAATRDFRFPPVAAGELERLRIEISVLTPETALEFRSGDDLLRQLRPGTDGVVLRVGEKLGTFLPQVWEEVPVREQFMEHLARKAGLGPDDWRRADARVSVYQAVHFTER
jgi:AmmeMemoRadiSam system protein A